jgi:hypothetical protein
MSKIENEAMDQLLCHITKQKKVLTNINNCCTAAVKYNTIGNAYNDIQKNIKVYLNKDEKNGTVKTYAYARCSKTVQENKDYCHLHCRMLVYNTSGLKIFDKDILPTSETVKTRWLANVNDDFFENMGKRGAKKKNKDNNFSFADEKHPVLLILIHKNAKLATQLSLYASQLLKGNYQNNDMLLLNTDLTKTTKTTTTATISTTPTPKIEPETSNDISSLLTLIKTNLSENEKLSSEEDDSNEEDSDDSDEDDSEKDESVDPDDSDGVSCIPITTNNGKLLWYDKEHNIVYEPEGEDGGEEIGILKEITNEYHTIVHNKKLYTVLKEIDIAKKGLIYCCVITNSLFDKNYEFIGSRTKLKNNTYKFDFTN